MNHYLNLFQDGLSFAALLRYAANLIRYISSHSNVKTGYVRESFHVLFDGIDAMIPENPLCKESVRELLLQVVEALTIGEKVAGISDSEHITETARQYILAHYSEAVSLSIIADHIGVNASYLSDLFHKHPGEPYSKYITRIRMEQASRIFRHNPNEKVYRAAAQTGFVSSKHFITVFRKFYGMTPTEYMDKIRRNLL